MDASTKLADEFLADEMIDDILAEEVVKLEGPACADGAHVPEETMGTATRCTRCERGLLRDSVEEPWQVNHHVWCRCRDCLPRRDVLGYPASKTKRVFRDEGYQPREGDQIWRVDSDGRAVHGIVRGARAVDGFFAVETRVFPLTATPTATVTIGVHRRYILRAVEEA